MEKEGDFLEVNPIRVVEAPEVEEKKIDIITEGQFKTLLTTGGRTFTGRRDRAALNLFGSLE